MPDGSGDSYAPGATIELSASATLYAQWNDSGSGDNDNNPETPVGPARARAIPATSISDLIRSS